MIDPLTISLHSSYALLLMVSPQSYVFRTWKFTDETLRLLNCYTHISKPVAREFLIEHKKRSLHG